MLLVFSYMSTLGVNFTKSVDDLTNQIILWVVIISNVFALLYGVIVIIRDFVIVVRQHSRKSIKITN